MLKKAKIMLPAIMLVLTGICGLMTTGRVMAADAFCDNLAGTEAWNAMGCNITGDNAFPKAIEYILKAVIAIGGLVAGIYIVVGGVKYITANGDAGKIKLAKETILYALIGLVVAALAFAIANWAIDIVNNA